jgi:ABC-2 type transport system ATP-binding protein
VVLDTPEAIARQAGGSMVRFVPSRPIEDMILYAIPGVNQVENGELYVTVTGTGDLAISVIDTLLKIGVQVSRLEARGGNLDDAFVKLTAHEASDASGGAKQ